MTCAVLIIDEAAYINENIIKSVMTPVLSVANTSILMVSTPGETPTALFNKMVRDKYVDSCSVEFICKPCREKGQRDPCIHNQDAIPDHLGENSDLIKAFYGEEDQAKRDREIMGILDTENGRNCFTERSVRALMSQPKVTLYDLIRYIYIAIDPSAGSKIAEKRGSDFCIVSSCGGANTIILGIDAIDVVVTQDYEPVLLSHIKRLREHPMLANATIVLDAESGTGYTAGDVQLLVQRNFDNVICMNELGRKPGTFTSNEAKREMVEIARSHLDAGDVKIWDQFVTSDPNPKAVLEKFANQIIDYERIVSPGKSIFQSHSVQYSGKMNGKKMDDIVQTFLRVCRDRLRFMYAKEYQHWHR